MTTMVAPDTSEDSGTTLRLLFPQWQGAGRDMVAHLTPDIPIEQARRGYATGTAVLQAMLPPHDGPTATVPVSSQEDESGIEGGVESKAVIVKQLGDALAVIADFDASRIVTIGGECSVSVAPFASLAAKYGDDLAVVWVDSHPDVGTPASKYAGYHAMAVAVLLGHGDPDVIRLLPATVPAAHVALAGLHSWTEDDFPNAAQWGVATFSPNALRESSQPLLEWLTATGCARLAVHLDVDVVDSDEQYFGLGGEPGGLTSTEVRRLIADLESACDVVGFTIAEYIPRQVMAVQRLLHEMPLL
jgi:arginase